VSISTTIQVAGATVRTLPAVTWTSGMNAQAVLEQAYVQGSGYSYLLQYFGAALGYEVMAFDGVSAVQGSDVGFYWEFIWNGQPAQQGIDATFPNDGDTLAFNYVVYDMAAHAGSRVEAVRKALAGAAA